MIKLVRKKEERWIFQKNISSDKLIKSYLEVVNNEKSFEKGTTKNNLRINGGYKGRSYNGSENTMGVRFSQMCFYMFGYKSPKTFVPTESTRNILKNNNSSFIAKNILVNLFSLQYPHPYSTTSSKFNIYAGRLIIKLLTDERIGFRLYFDEFIYFLLFFKEINYDLYEQLVTSIVEYRNLTFYEKFALFKAEDNYENLFANCLHETKYYFSRIFEGFHVLNIKKDPEHNEGLCFTFRHGKTKTFRNDGISGEPGFIELNNELIPCAKALLAKFSVFDEPTTEKSKGVYSKYDWIYDLYEIEFMKYLETILPECYEHQENVIKDIGTMVYESKYGSKDGKGFESALRKSFELFREVKNSELISGPGDTDIVCTVENENEIYNIDIEAKTNSSYNNLNVMRLERHASKRNSRYSIVVAPRFARANKEDVENSNIVLLKADVLGDYLLRECLSSDDNLASFKELEKIIMHNLGTDISIKVQSFINRKFGIDIS